MDGAMTSLTVKVNGAWHSVLYQIVILSVGHYLKLECDLPAPMFKFMLCSSETLTMTAQPLLSSKLSSTS